MYPFLRIFIGGEFFLSKSLSSKKPYVIIANHNSHVDTLSILSSLPLSQLGKTQPVAAKDYFARTLFVKVLSLTFVHPLFIDRKNRDMKEKTIEKMTRALQAGNNLIVFPEGSRDFSDEVKKFKKGIVSVLKNVPEANFIPVYISSSKNVLPKGDAMVVPYNYKVIFGELMSIDKSKSDEDNIEFIRSKVLELDGLSRFS